jgi:hypothetical protein
MSEPTKTPRPTILPAPAPAPPLPDYAHYTEPAFRAEFVADMERPSPLRHLATNGIVRLRYDAAQFDVRALVGDALAAAGMFARDALADRGDRLEQLHTLVAAEHQTMDRSQQSAAARVLYEMPPAFTALHERLMAEVVIPALGLGPAHCQRTPTFRVFFPHAPGYPGATSYHNDIMLGHNPRAVNVFIPLVRCEGTRALQLAELPDSLALLREYDFDFATFGRDTQQNPTLMARCERICRPLVADVGELFVFDSRCVHAGPHNRTDLTRVTFDSRLLPAAAIAGQRNTYFGRGRRRADFAVGAYYTADALGSCPVGTK